jgi:hypothetical protein
MRRWRPLVALKNSNHGPNTDAHLTGDSLDREPGFMKPHDFIAIEDPTRAPDLLQA